MGKIAFLFPGQGAQYVGMGKDFYDAFPIAKEIYAKASESCGLDVEALCFQENEQLNQTEYTQIAMVATEVAILKVVEDLGIRADYAAGLSLGEYGALAACDAMELGDLFRIIRQRGILMQEAYPSGGAMMAILGLEIEKVREICEQTEGIVSVANDNCPGQVVITGEEKAVALAAEQMAQAGAKRCVSLKVSGPFHSELLAEAGEKLGKELESVTVKELKIPYFCNVDASKVEKAENVKELLAKQVSCGVRFRETILEMKKQGVTTFVEIGPGKTLTGFVRKIDKDLITINVEKVSDLEKLTAVC